MTLLAATRPTKYLAVLRTGCRQALLERGGLIASCAFLLLILLVFSQLWEAMRVTGALQDLDAADLLWYLAITEWIAIGTAQVWRTIQEDIRTGDIAYLLPRPINYIGYRIADAYGRLAVRLVCMGCAAFIGAWAFSGSLPSNALGLVYAAPLALLAALVLVIFYAWIGLLAFWLQDAQPAYFIFQKLLFVFGGLMLPLTIYPAWLRSLSAWTPFSAILFGPANTVVEADPVEALWVAARLILWGCVATTLLLWTYTKARRSLEVNGG